MSANFGFDVFSQAVAQQNRAGLGRLGCGHMNGQTIVLVSLGPDTKLVEERLVVAARGLVARGQVDAFDVVGEVERHLQVVDLDAESLCCLAQRALSCLNFRLDALALLAERIGRDLVAFLHVHADEPALLGFELLNQGRLGVFDLGRARWLTPASARIASLLR